jgi:hypothetical protein
MSVGGLSLLKTLFKGFPDRLIWRFTGEQGELEGDLFDLWVADGERHDWVPKRR